MQECGLQFWDTVDPVTPGGYQRGNSRPSGQEKKCLNFQLFLAHIFSPSFSDCYSISCPLVSPSLPFIFFASCKLSSCSLLLCPSNVQTKVPVIAGKGECWRTSFKFGPDYSSRSGMNLLVMSCNVTCSTSAFTILFAPLPHHLFFLDLFRDCSFLTNWTLLDLFVFLLVNAAVFCWPYLLRGEKKELLYCFVLQWEWFSR